MYLTKLCPAKTNSLQLRPRLYLNVLIEIRRLNTQTKLPFQIGLNFLPVTVESCC